MAADDQLRRLEFDDVTLRFGGITALDRLSFGVLDGEICGLIGPNGAGKTTALNLVSLVYTPTSGVVRFAGTSLREVRQHQIARLGIARTFQNLALWPGLTVLENVMLGAHSRTNGTALGAAFGFGRRRDRALAEECYDILESLELAAVAFAPATGLPFGTLKLVELARAMAARPTFLMLDEPASGLIHSEVDELADVIRRLRDRYGLTVLLVEHHMGMVMGLCERIVVLDFGRAIAEGPPAEVSRDPRVIEAYLGVS